MFEWLERLFWNPYEIARQANWKLEQDKTNNPSLVSKSGLMFTPNEDYTREMAEYDASVDMMFQSDEARQRHKAVILHELDPFWLKVREATEKKIGSKLSDSTWNDPKVRERWRQRLNMVR